MGGWARVRVRRQATVNTLRVSHPRGELGRADRMRLQVVVVCGHVARVARATAHPVAVHAPPQRCSAILLRSSGSAKNLLYDGDCSGTATTALPHATCQSGARPESRFKPGRSPVLQDHRRASHVLDRVRQSTPAPANRSTAEHDMLTWARRPRTRWG
jgi:hypothetical protein